MMYKETFHIRLTEKQMTILSRLAKRDGVSRADVVRGAIEIIGADDYVIIPVTVKERLFIEGICQTAGVQPSDAVKMVLLSYHTLMSSPLWKIVRPVDEILDEMKVEGIERERAGEGGKQS